MSEVSNPIASTAQAGPATPTQSTVGTVEQTGVKTSAGPGEAITFDDIETVVAETKAKVKKAKEKPEFKGKPVNEDLTPEVHDISKEKESGSAKKEKVEAKKTGKEEAEKPVEDAGKEVVKAADPGAKKLKFKAGGQDGDIPETATFKVKVAGKEMEVPASELVKNYSGKVQWDKKFTELDTERVQFKQKFQKVESIINAALGEKDPDMRLFKMAELSGKDPVQFRKDYLDSNLPMLEKWYAMSDEERNADQLAFENKYLRHKSEAHKKDEELKVAQAALSTRVDNLLARHKISKEEFAQRYDQVEDLVAKGTLTKDHLNPEFITEVAAKERLWDAGQESLTALGVEIPVSKFKVFVDDAYKNDFEPQDIAELIDKIWGVSGAKEVIDNKKKDKEEFLHGSKEVSKSGSKSEPMFFDELMN